MLSGGTAEGPVRAEENEIILRLARARNRYTRLLHPGAELLGSYPRTFHAKPSRLCIPFRISKSAEFRKDLGLKHIPIAQSFDNRW
jgi:hypothetical protein